MVWAGDQPFSVNSFPLDKLPKTNTKLMMNLANPEMAFDHSFLPNQGVGLARMEFIINNHIKAHPLALLYPEKLSKDEFNQVESLARGFGAFDEFFVEKLANGVGLLAAAFHPKPVILRFSDFKSNEYSHLLGGSHFEPVEENPMIGWRGASRYYSDDYKEAFALECRAVKRVRERYGLDNLVVMVPFCRTPEEGKLVIAEMRKNGLEQGHGGDAENKQLPLKVYCMAEIPSNVLQADEFLDVFDGFSIGSNDLTQLTLGLDRDSSTVSHLFDERNPAVKKLMVQVIDAAKARGKYVGICGQAPSDYPEVAEFLVRHGIESMSLNPDTIVQTMINIAKVEEDLWSSDMSNSRAGL
jgi:pyruvate,water dikinase